MADVAQELPGGQQFPPNTIDEAKRQRLLELVRGRAMARPTDLAEDEVMVWPSLVVVEAVCATVFLLIITILSILVNGPLIDRANPNQTPNPSKAPWYFLNLQELLLHMNAGLAGVIVPTVALIAIAAIPYFDRSPLGVGILGTSAKGRKIILFTVVYCLILLPAMIYFDELSGRTVFGIGRYLRETLGMPELIYNGVLPAIVLVALIAIFVGIVKTLFRPTRRELIIALFTGFAASYVILTVSGTAFRGQTQTLTWPWELLKIQH